MIIQSESSKFDTKFQNLMIGPVIWCLKISWFDEKFDDLTKILISWSKIWWFHQKSNWKFQIFMIRPKTSNFDSKPQNLMIQPSNFKIRPENLKVDTKVRNLMLFYPSFDNLTKNFTHWPKIWRFNPDFVFEFYPQFSCI